MRLSGTKTNSVNQYRGLGDQLWDLGGARPTLDLNFAQSKDLTDATTGKDYVDFTRASSGTYVGSDGLIKTATTNLLLQSEDFSTTWSVASTTVTTNSILSPNGTLTADTLTDTNAAGDAYTRQTISSPISGGTYTASVFLKQGSTATTRISINFIGATAVASEATVNWSTNTTSFGTFQSFGNGWYRLSFSATNNTSGNTSLLYTIRASGDVTGAETGFVYAWGAQLEQSTTVGEYVKTTSTINSAPRFDHDPTTGESLGLLVEESRTNLLTQSQELTASTGTGVTLNAATSPLGTSTAVVVTEDNTSGIHAVATQAATVSAVTTTCSFYGKANGRSWVVLRLGGVNRAWFNLSTGQIGTVDAGTSATTIQAFSNGFYRCSCTFTPVAGAANIFFRMGTADGTDSYLGDNTSGVILFGFQIEAGSFPTSYIPTTTSTVTRAADVASISGSNFGTFRTNLLQYSEEFDQGAWTGASPTVTPNVALSPDGTITADKVEVAQVRQTANPVTAGANYAISFYIKSDETTAAAIRLRAGYSGGASNFWWIPSTGLFGTVGADFSNATVTSIGNNWYRVSAIFTVPSGVTSVEFAISGVNADGGGTISGHFVVWGAQLEEGSTATPYIKSDVNFVSRASSATYYDANGVIQTAAVDEARTAAYLPDGNGNFVSAGPLLLEPAGTNLLLQSEDFSTTWGATRVSVTTNAALAPNGTITADKIVENSDNNSHFVAQTNSLTSGTSYTASVYAKAGERSILQGSISGLYLTTLGYVNFNLSAGTVTVTDGGAAGSITPVGGGWYRCIVNFTANATASGGFAWMLQTSTTASRGASYQGDGTSGLYIWGAQLEANSYPTSYIPTTTSTATRAADVSTSAATTVFESDWYRQGEGTVFAEAAYNNDTAGSLAFFNGASYSNLLSLQREPSLDRWQVDYFSGGSRQALLNLQTSTAPTGITSKISTSYQVNSFNASANGGAVISDTSGLVPASVTRVSLGYENVGPSSWINGTIRRLTYWPTRLGNEVLQTITQ